ncbi:hypothetical protein Csa_015065 [Cucumis sativus]|uniref:Uncharacterized protein n=1 Tax=Cucumis sativus TaxID=3659 RepID=A0A0A0KT34_CUCSA|nr:hypothetical protein Csa_015065 [Cucumis sativus]
MLYKVEFEEENENEDSGRQNACVIKIGFHYQKYINSQISNTHTQNHNFEASIFSSFCSKFQRNFECSSLQNPNSHHNSLSSWP